MDVERNAEPLKIESSPPPVAVQPLEATQPTQTLTDLVDELVYFTPALLVTHGGFDRDPVMEYLRRNCPPADLRPLEIDCEHPFFYDLPTRPVQRKLINWSHRLYAVPKAGWADCAGFIGALAWSSSRHHFYGRAVLEETQMIDQLKLHGSPVLNVMPLVPLFVFAASTTRLFARLGPSRYPVAANGRLSPVISSPMPDLLFEAQAVLGPPPDRSAAGCRPGADTDLEQLRLHLLQQPTTN